MPQSAGAGARVASRVACRRAYLFLRRWSILRSKLCRVPSSGERRKLRVTEQRPKKTSPEQGGWERTRRKAGVRYRLRWSLEWVRRCVLRVVDCSGSGDGDQRRVRVLLSRVVRSATSRNGVGSRAGQCWGALLQREACQCQENSSSRRTDVKQRVAAHNKSPGKMGCRIGEASGEGSSGRQRRARAGVGQWRMQRTCDGGGQLGAVGGRRW